jgi:hypothetical protein
MGQAHTLSHQLAEVIKLFDLEIVSNVESEVLCPRGSTCECPRAHALVQQFDLVSVHCSNNTCPVQVVHEQYLHTLVS